MGFKATFVLEEAVDITHVYLMWCRPKVCNIGASGLVSYFKQGLSSMERTPHWSLRASSDSLLHFHLSHMTVCQFIIFTIFTITACIFSYSLSISFWTQDLAVQQIFSSIDLFFFYQPDSTDSRTI